MQLNAKYNACTGITIILLPAKKKCLFLGQMLTPKDKITNATGS